MKQYYLFNLNKQDYYVELNEKNKKIKRNLKDFNIYSMRYFNEETNIFQEFWDSEKINFKIIKTIPSFAKNGEKFLSSIALTKSMNKQGSFSFVYEKFKMIFKIYNLTHEVIDIDFKKKTFKLKIENEEFYFKDYRLRNKNGYSESIYSSKQISNAEFENFLKFIKNNTNIKINKVNIDDLALQDIISNINYLKGRIPYTSIETLIDNKTELESLKIHSSFFKEEINKKIKLELEGLDSNIEFKDKKIKECKKEFFQLIKKAKEQNIELSYLIKKECLDILEEYKTLQRNEKYHEDSKNQFLKQRKELEDLKIND